MRQNQVQRIRNTIFSMYSLCNFKYPVVMKSNNENQDKST